METISSYLSPELIQSTEPEESKNKRQEKENAGTATETALVLEAGVISRTTVLSNPLISSEGKHPNSHLNDGGLRLTHAVHSNDSDHRGQPDRVDDLHAHSCIKESHVLTILEETTINPLGTETTREAIDVNVDVTRDMPPTSPIEEKQVGEQQVVVKVEKALQCGVCKRYVLAKQYSGNRLVQPCFPFSLPSLLFSIIKSYCTCWLCTLRYMLASSFFVTSTVAGRKTKESQRQAQVQSMCAWSKRRLTIKYIHSSQAGQSHANANSAPTSLH